MMYVRYIVCAVPWPLLAAFQCLLGWIFIAPFVKRDGNLPSLLRIWFQPDDTPAIGDADFANNEAKGVRSFYIRAVMWGMRNPAYGWLARRGIKSADYTLLYADGNPSIDIGDYGSVFGRYFKVAKISRKRYFDYKRVGRWGDTRYGYQLRFGWNLATAFSPIPGTVRGLQIEVRPRVLIK